MSKVTSHYLSMVLRHKPEALGLSLDPEGFIATETLIAACLAAGKKCSMERLEHIVATDNKQRYSFSPDKTKIRANQGHSVPVDLKLEPQQPPDTLYHGTVHYYVQSILNEGLKKRNRQYVHLSVDIETATNVGSRRGEPVLLALSAAKMAADGHSFYLSENGVWLTDFVPPAYIKLV